MTEVLAIPRQPDGQSFYEPSALHPSPPSSSSLFLDPATPPSSSSSSLKNPSTPHAGHQEQTSDSTPLPPPPPPPTTTTSTPHFSSSISSDDHSTTASATSSVSSHLSLHTDITFPNYDPDIALPPSSPAFCDGDDNCSEPNESTATDTTISESPLPTPTIVDDSALRQEPSRQVDFLSHEWREEDIWSSWRNIVSQRKTVLKESDVTWLYGPLKLAPSYPISERSASQSESQISKSNSFVNKKPILKKRSVSEVMLQKSLSTSSLVKQAAAQVQAQGRDGRRSGPEVIDSKLQSEPPSRDQIDYFTSWSNSGGGTPCETHERRHIRFDDRVEQCIAVDCKDPGPEDGEESDDAEAHGQTSSSDSSSDDGVVMMKRKKRSGPKKGKNGSRSNSANGRKIIETLPATTLKYRTDSPDVTEEAQHHTFGRSWNSSRLSPSPSQETLRPTRPSSNFLLPDDEDDAEDDIDSDSSWTFGASNNKSSLGTASSPTSRRSGGPSSRNRSSTPGPRESHYEIEGMRRTESGMFMPYDDDEDDIVAAGLFGRVSETINTARDIAHVIWYVNPSCLDLSVLANKRIGMLAGGNENAQK
ncbi:hypothetical protein AC579_6579 [Pseudocercospora musae]|uniref:Nitrogen regulatory protein areA GATA-like domain-containing protein n=1 Tax=Pseudocercospora musae TaxID=113226 RepID=A0A139I9W1_9PEZI|nr:hypothetical protein AC579_6579 [Pseudocercospora musae]